MPIQRSVRSPRYDDYHNYPRNHNNKHSKHQNELQIQQQIQQCIQQSPREVENINEIRKLIREQSNLTLKSNRQRNSNSDSSDEVEVPVRRFTPLPDIPRSDDAYFRTESRLIKDKEITDDSFLIDDSSANVDIAQYAYDSTINFTSKRETKYHFGASTQNKINFSHRLPALEKQINHSLQNTMDLDEDLPMNPVSEPDVQNQRMIYTSPGDRIISPIKRPPAPSPAASAYRRKKIKIRILIQITTLYYNSINMKEFFNLL